MIRYIESVTSPGVSDPKNEDRVYFNNESIGVIDGATGLGDKNYLSSKYSDAEYLAECARLFFSTNLNKNTNTKNIIEQFILSFTNKNKEKLVEMRFVIAP